MKYDNTQYDSAYRLYSDIRTEDGVPGHGPYSKAQEKKIRKRIEMYLGGMTEEQRLLCSKENNIENIMEYLKQCRNRYERCEEDKRAYRAEMLEKLGASEAMPHIGYDTYIYMEHKQGQNEKEICIRCADTYSCDLTLVLENVITDHDFSYDCGQEDCWEISECDTGYEFKYLENRFDGESRRLHVAYFTSTRIEKRVFSALNVPIIGSFKEYVLSIARELYERISEFNMPANELEMELLPLARFLAGFDVGEEQSIPQTVEERFLGIGRICTRDNAKKLHRAEYEPFWRRIYAVFLESQKDYKCKAETCYTEEELKQIMTDIDKAMKENSYEGTYPNYYKRDMENEVTYYIKCHDLYSIEYVMKYPSLCFVCGGIRDGAIDRIKVDNTDWKEDVFSCMFYQRGERYFEILELRDTKNNVGEDEKASAYEYAAVAAKKAAKQKLTRAERKNPDFRKTDIDVGWLIGMFIFMAIVFGGLITLGLIAVSTVITFICTWSVKTVGEMLVSMPWLWLGLLAGSMFGAAMVLACIISYKRYK